MKKVCHLTSAHPCKDNRIFYKECVSLANAGLDVSFIVQNNKDEKIDGVNIIAIPFSNDRLKRMLINPILIFFKALKTRASVFHFHDPELIFVGYILKLFGKKIVYDVHEDYSEQIITKEWIKFLFIRNIVSKTIVVLEFFCGKIFNNIVVVSDTIGKKFPQKKVILIRNMPILALIDSKEAINYNKDYKVVIYTGGLTRIRGIYEIVEAMKYTTSNVKLWLLGKWEDEEYRNQCMNSAGWTNVEYIGFIPFGEHYKYIKASDVGIVTFLPFKNHINAMPNKPFEYMACKKPIIMSNFSLWENLFSGVALYTNPTDSLEIAKNIDNIINNDELRLEMGVKGRQYVEREYSWEAESKRLIEMYNNLLRKKKK